MIKKLKLRLIIILQEDIGVKSTKKINQMESECLHKTMPIQKHRLISMKVNLLMED